MFTLRSRAAIAGAAVLLSFSSPALAAFPDVSSSHAYREAIEYVQREGIVSGYPDGTYRPDATINRAEFVKLIAGAALDYDPGRDPSDFDIYALAGVPFSDVEHGAWYIPHLREARQRGIIGGYPDGTFRPGQSVNFAEAAKIIVAAFGHQLHPSEPWYEPFLLKLSELHAIPLSITGPAALLTRGEMAEIIWRLRAAVRDRPSMNLDSRGMLCLAFQEEAVPRADMAAVRAAWLSWMNAERTERGLSPYRLNPQLDRTAFLWSKEMAERGVVSHRRYEGSAYYDYAEITQWFRNLGIAFRNVNRATYSENIGYGLYRCDAPDCTQALIESIRTTFDGYLAEESRPDQPHFRSIVHPSFREIGVGITLDSSGKSYYITTHYGTDLAPKPPPLCQELR